MSDLTNDLIAFGVYVVRHVVGAVLCCRRVCTLNREDSPVRTCHATNRVLGEGDEVPSAVVLETWSRGSTKKSWVQYTGETIVDHPSPFGSFQSAPWCWVGYKTVSGDMHDLTSELSEFVVNGNVIKPALIHTMFPRSETGSLVYIDSSTFETKDLSSDGLVIGTHVEMERPSSPTTVPTLLPSGGGVSSDTESDGTSGVDGDHSSVE